MRFQLMTLILVAVSLLIAPALATPERKIKNLLHFKTDRGDEDQILRLLEQCNADELEATLVEVDLRRLLKAVHIRRRPLFKLLGQDRVQDLSLQSRSLLIEALQAGSTGDFEEDILVSIFLATQGSDLTCLKNLVDQGEDYQGLHHLVTKDLDSPQRVETLLRHFQEQAEGLPRGRKVVSDFDDTFFCNLKDDRYPDKCVYPGVREFYRALTIPLDGEGGPVIMTARPRFQKEGVRRGLVARGLDRTTVVHGSLSTVFSRESMADKKFRNFEWLARLYPEYDFCVIGDSGQGDGFLALQLLTQYPDRVKGVFLHDLQNEPNPPRSELSAAGVMLFRNYAQAAEQARAKGLLSDEASREIMAAARRELDEVEFDSAEQKAQRMEELRQDIAGK